MAENKKQDLEKDIEDFAEEMKENKKEEKVMEKETMKKETKKVELNVGTFSKVQKYNGGKVVARYPYANRDGIIDFEIWRMEGAKEPFYAMHIGKDGQELPGMGKASPIIYNLPKVLEAKENRKTIFIVEGESKADVLNELGYVATTAPFSGTDKWNERYNKYVKYANVLILADNDDKSREFAENTYSEVSEYANNVGIIELVSLYPQLKKGGDIEDLRNIVNDDEYLKETLDSIINDLLSENKEEK